MPTTQTLNRQLADIRAQLDAASERAASIVNSVNSEQLNERPQPGEWSLKTRVDVAAVSLPLDRIKIASPFDRRFKYNLFSFFHILLAHERRHLWQAERVKEAIAQ